MKACCEFFMSFMLFMVKKLLSRHGKNNGKP